MDIKAAVNTSSCSSSFQLKVLTPTFSFLPLLMAIARYTASPLQVGRYQVVLAPPYCMNQPGKYFNRTMKFIRTVPLHNTEGPPHFVLGSWDWFSCKTTNAVKQAMQAAWIWRPSGIFVSPPQCKSHMWCTAYKEWNKKK